MRCCHFTSRPSRAFCLTRLCSGGSNTIGMLFFPEIWCLIRSLIRSWNYPTNRANNTRWRMLLCPCVGRRVSAIWALVRRWFFQRIVSERSTIDSLKNTQGLRWMRWVGRKMLKGGSWCCLDLIVWLLHSQWSWRPSMLLPRKAGEYLLSWRRDCMLQRWLMKWLPAAVFKSSRVCWNNHLDISTNCLMVGNKHYWPFDGWTVSDHGK